MRSSASLFEYLPQSIVFRYFTWFLCKVGNGNAWMDDVVGFERAGERRLGDGDGDGEGGD